MNSTRLKQILAQAVRVSPEDIDDSADQLSLPEWDSLSHIDLLDGIEQALPGALQRHPQLATATSFEELALILVDED